MIVSDANRVDLPDDLRAMGSQYVAMQYCGNQARRHIVIHRAEAVAAALRLDRGNVLDLGCGPGYSSVLVARRVSGVTAVDIDPVKLKIADRLARLNRVSVHVALADASATLPFETGRFDGLVSLELIEHIRDWRALVGEMCRVVRPEGRIAVSTPRPLGAAQVVKTLLLRSGLKAESTYEWFISPRAIVKAFGEEGVEITGVENVVFTAPMVPDPAMPAVKGLERLVESLPPLNRLCSTAIYCGIRR